MRVQIRDESDVGAARRLVRELATNEGLTPASVEALATAVSEVARNILVHAGAGDILVELVVQVARRGIVVTARDAGPGIADLDRAMTDSYSTGDGLGLGLAGAKRLVHEFAIESILGCGTAITMTVWTWVEHPT